MYSFDINVARTENPCVAGSIPAGTTLKKAFSNGKAFFIR